MRQTSVTFSSHEPRLRLFQRRAEHELEITETHPAPLQFLLLLREIW